MEIIVPRILLYGILAYKQVTNLTNIKNQRKMWNILLKCYLPVFILIWLHFSDKITYKNTYYTLRSKINEVFLKKKKYKI